LASEEKSPRYWKSGAILAMLTSPGGALPLSAATLTPASV
jgi:hypothetical protein